MSFRAPRQASPQEILAEKHKNSYFHYTNDYKYTSVDAFCLHLANSEFTKKGCIDILL